MTEMLTELVWQAFGEADHKKGGWGCMIAAFLVPMLLVGGVLYLIWRIFQF
jgi:hypothetical protein